MSSHQLRLSLNVLLKVSEELHFETSTSLRCREPPYMARRCASTGHQRAIVALELWETFVAILIESHDPPLLSSAFGNLSSPLCNCQLDFETNAEPSGGCGCW
jgi:hypothetical protein